MIAPCVTCGAETDRTLGALAMCPECREAVLAPIRRHVIERYGAVDVIHRMPATCERLAPDHGVGLWWLRCNECAASWVGAMGDECSWCIDRLEAIRSYERENLLRPSWLIPSHGKRYDELSDIDKQVWDRTRGQMHGTDSEAEWVRSLGRAINRSVITRTEADNAIARLARAWQAI